MKTAYTLIAVLALSFTLSNSAEAKGKKKMSYAQAKKACLKDDASLAGKPLQKCIKERR